MKITLYRYSMLIAAFALLALAVFYFVTYAGVVGAVGNSADISPFYRNSIQGLWLTFASQSLLLALLYFLVASKPRSVSREVIVICGLLQLVAAILIFYFARSTIPMYLLAAAALFVLAGSVLWPSAEEVAAEKMRAAAAIAPTPASITPPTSTSATYPPGATPPPSADNSGL
jgi:hypothetical protein